MVFTLRVPSDQAEYVQRAVTVGVDRVIDDAAGVGGGVSRAEVVAG